jgi:hypothetical protein
MKKLRARPGLGSPESFRAPLENGASCLAILKHWPHPEMRNLGHVADPGLLPKKAPLYTPNALLPHFLGV